MFRDWIGDRRNGYDRRHDEAIDMTNMVDILGSVAFAVAMIVFAEVTIYLGRLAAGM